ncbi:MAG: alpha-amylase [Herpetosiphonaceae bacterium]|nr:MAG: alpha-amylase [Herpetosiphonaceae bacterium]
MTQADDAAPAAFCTPEWVKHAVFYQIFPERFANGDPTNDPSNAQPWGSPPTPYNFMGGDLQGIIEQLDYLQQLGVTALYLTPIFQSTSNHKYNTYDYFRIDPRFGSLETFQRLTAELHRRGMRLILDGVFNHCGRGLFQFHDVVENGAASPYVGWFHIERFPIHPYDLHQPANYRTWWDVRSLPKFNTDNPEVRRFLLSIARYWIEQGADGWRLDVPNEIADHNFWREFRQVVKEANPEAYIVGEIWHDGTPWLGGDQFDAVMNYLFRDLCVDFFARCSINAAVFGEAIDRLLGLYQPEVTYSLLNLLGSHDTARFLTVAGGDGAGIKLAITFLMTYPGAPCIYYGDEIGMQGEADPGCRGAFPWNEEQWNVDLLEHTRRMIGLRRGHEALRTGHFRSLLADGSANVYAFARWNERQRFVVAINNSDALQFVSVPLPHEILLGLRELHMVEDQSIYPVYNGRIEGLRLPPRSAAVLSGAVA